MQHPGETPSRRDLGYLNDQPWTFTYHDSLSPNHIRFALALAGREPPPVSSYLELAYGQGVSLVIHAACNQHIRWTGTDFNPGHLAFAAELAGNGALANLTLLGHSFSDLQAAITADAYDVVTNVGTWSWLPPEAQGAIASVLKAHLQPGGLFCLVHATRPGQDGSDGFTRILANLATTPREAGASPSDYIPATLRQAIAFFDTNPGFFEQHWGLRETAEHLLPLPPAELAHEYFNEHFRPAYFADVVRSLGDAGLAWAAPWDLSDRVEGLHLTPRQRDFVATIAGDVAREQIRDFVLNRGQRRDIFARAPALRRGDRRELLAGFRFMRVKPAGNFKFRAWGGNGELVLAEEFYRPLIAALSDGAPQSIEALHGALDKRWTIDEVIDAMALLVADGFAQVLQPSGDMAERSRDTAAALNQRILAMDRATGGIEHLGSPVTGCGLKVPRQHRLFLRAHLDGARTSEAYARHAFAILEAEAAPALARGEDVAKPQAVLVNRDAEAFVATHLPIYRSLQLLPAL